MAHIVGQLLDIAELDAVAIDPSDTADLQSVAAEVAEFVAPLALAQGKDVALSGATEPVWVKGSAEMLSRAIRNLAENAIRHAPRDTLVEFVVEENGTVSVQDRGPGISDQERELIFRRALRPLREASDIAAEIGPARPGLRLPTKEIPREVRPLVSAVNLALDRLEEGFKIQRDFTADAAHELRTPLSILRTRIDVLEDSDIRQALRQNV